SEQVVDIKYELKPRFESKSQGWLPHGFPVLGMRLEAQPPDPLFLSAQGLGRQARETNGKDPSKPLSFEFKVQRDEKALRVPVIQRATVGPIGFYRGQVIRLNNTVLLHRWPENLVYHHDPDLEPTAAIAVRADGDIHDILAPRRGAICIVVDC